MTNDLITVITVVLNKKEELEKTIQSVANQTYKNVEHIIIDGGSKDGTLNVIRKYQHTIRAWISEPDEGIYDAMNKGIRLAKGDWINFMNAGDIFYNADSVSLLSDYFRSDVSLIYGDVEIDYTVFKRTQRAKHISTLWKGIVCCHQSVFIKRQILDKLMFNSKYNLAADYELLCRAYLGGCRAAKVDMIISRVTNGGQADLKRVEVLREFKRVACRNFKAKAAYISVRYQALILVEKVKMWVKRYFPEHVVNLFIKQKYGLDKK